MANDEGGAGGVGLELLDQVFDAEGQVEQNVHDRDHRQEHVGGAHLHRTGLACSIDRSITTNK